jgi:hypothetical protein
MLFAVFSTNESPSILPPEKKKEFSAEIQKFKLPITYLDPTDLYKLSDNVSADLELTKNTEDIVKTKPIYDYLFRPSHSFAKHLIPEWNKQYTTNQKFLQESQEIIKHLDIYKSTMKSSSAPELSPPNCDKITDIWKTLKNDDFFHEKYSFLEWDFLKYLNKSSYFMQFISYINVLSPLLSLFIPFLLLFFPFLLLKLQGIPITFTTYLQTLKQIARNHFIGKTLFSLESMNWDKMVYVVFTGALYFIQIYQNINNCYKFYTNMKKINDSLIEIRGFSEYSIRSMKTFMVIIEDCPSYAAFRADVKKHVAILENIQQQCQNISAFVSDFNHLNGCGYSLKCFYDLYENADYENSLRFAMGFEGYMDNLLGVFENIQLGHVSFASFSSIKNDCYFEEQFYPPLRDETPIKNECNLDKNMIISAPNKAGKTTILKTTTINIIFTQQVGCGFYRSAELTPYTHIHSYLNIPDTSGRDSLFQAESRRCKEIIDAINDNNDSNKYRHFCIFDELYSGTNPVEACKAGYAFLKYLGKYPNVRFMLTTHYLSICKRFRKSENIQNYKMQVNVLKDGTFDYTYRLKRGISKRKGAVRVLKDMDYPKEIIDCIEAEC